MSDLQDDFVAMGFERLDEKYVSDNPPKIKWGKKYKSWSEERKIAYLEKFAASMNEAAARLQNERDELNKLCDKKERQIESLNEAMRQNNMMLQTQIEKINAERQSYHEAYAKLKRELKQAA